MAHLTNGNTTSKINRIQDEEKQLLYQLRELYGLFVRVFLSLNIWLFFQLVITENTASTSAENRIYQ